MADGQGPWGGPKPDEPPPRRPRAPSHRLWIWLAVAAVVAGGLALLFKAFPGQLHAPDEWGRLGYLVALIAAMSAGLLRAREINWGQKARHAAVWVAIVAVMAVAVAYRGEFEGVGEHLRTAFSGAYPVATGAHEMVVPQEDNGGFYVMAQINGQPIRFLIDTGASDTVLSPDDAHRLGLDAPGLAFSRLAETANGTGYGAPIIVGRLTIGSIEMTDMPMVINKAPMTMSLLGMSFLTRLESFQIRDRRLYMKARS
jgi:aspartyl protease family protein